MLFPRFIRIDLNGIACQHSAMIKINPLPAYSDNYIWLIQFGDHQVVVIDPGDAAPVQQALQQQGLQLAAILVTHNHWDHIDGIETLLQQHPVPVYGPASGQTPGLTQPCKAGQQIQIGELNLEVMDVPGHTPDHIAYYGHQSLFCGDTLFAAGCGRLLGGSAEQLHDSLNKIAKLPINTNIYCTHEYTLANLKFAQAVEPDNQQIRQRITTETKKRQQGQPTLPSSLQLELASNPFLRCQSDTVKASA
ncbi:MAG TPA: hydroxyacylglutathione hydrolase, partial [Candidatus Tenderia electrophaga]|nr:hydroxyacylglutathione hydrolase [Candidatus Tenderia electrophaga]